MLKAYVFSQSYTEGNDAYPSSLFYEIFHELLGSVGAATVDETHLVNYDIPFENGLEVSMEVATVFLFVQHRNDYQYNYGWFLSKTYLRVNKTEVYDTNKLTLGFLCQMGLKETSPFLLHTHYLISRAML